MPDKTVVGFIGLGIMGQPMALNLVRAGYPLVVHNRTRAKEDELVSEGAQNADGPRQVAERAEIVITMLPDSPDVEAVYLGEDGVIAGTRAGQLLIDMSSVAPATARTVFAAAQDVEAVSLDAPVSGEMWAPATAPCRSWWAGRRTRSNEPARSSTCSARRSCVSERPVPARRPRRATRCSSRSRSKR